jgi:alpha-N-acetylglucosaminidase
MENMTIEKFMPTALFYDPGDLQVAWKLLLDSSSESSTLSSLETFRYDLVDVTRQCLSDLLLDGQIEMWQAYEKRNLTLFRSLSRKFIDILSDLDRILSTHYLFLFETQWLEPARAVAGDDDTLSAFYEFNAKNQVTMWGPEGKERMA